MKSKEKELHELKPLEISVNTIIKTLKAELPPFPEAIKIEQEQVPVADKKFKDI